MDVQAQDRGVLGFGPFRIDCARRHLTCNGTRVKISPRLFDTLSYFVANAGRIVEKDELMQAVWGGRIVEDANLSQTVFALRKVLRDEGGTDEAIVTAPGRGYRFILPVHTEAAGLPVSLPFADAPSVSEPAAIHAAGAVPAYARRRPFAALLVLALLVAGAGLLALRGRHPAPRAEDTFAPPPHSVAVLAFANMTGDPAKLYFSDGLSEELINALARVGSLRVAARTSAFSFRDSHVTVSEIGRRLNVGAVLEGSVRREGGRLRIAAGLTDTASGFMLWSHAYDTDEAGTLKLQAEIAGAVTEALRVTLGAGEIGKLSLGGTQNQAAYDAFLHGIGVEHGGDEASIIEARKDFEQAVTLDPLYAVAHAALSRTLNWIASSGTMSDLALVNAMKDRALAEADRAIALAPDLADGYVTRARVLEDRLAFGEAYDAVRRAAELGHGSAAVQQFYGQFASRMGHVAEGEAAERSGLALDPLSARSYFALAVVYLIDRRYDDALGALRQMEAIAGRVPPIAAQLTVVIALKRQQWDLALSLAGKTQGWPKAEYEAIAYHALGRQAEADAAFARLQGLQGENGNFQYAEVYAQWGQPDRALAALDEAYRDSDAGLVDLRSSLFLDPIRSTPHYADLLQRLHIPP
jgi:TolB-like protein/DNA-binding winged helix-turn-helix (wHTH) protein